MRIVRGYVDTSIGQMHYRQVGKGKNLILFHKTPTCSEVYEPLMRLLAPHGFSVVAIDNPGWGMSAWLPPGFTIPDIVRVMLETMDGLGIRRASLFGHYTGASVACEIAASAPRRVEKLILSGPVNYPPDARRERYGRFARTGLSEDGSHLKELWDGLSTTRLAPPEKALDLERRHRAMVWRLQAEPRVIEFPTAVFGYDMASRLPSIKAPSLVIAGEYDLQRDTLEPTARAIPGAKHYLVPGGTMWIDTQQPEDLARIIVGFILDYQV